MTHTRLECPRCRENVVKGSLYCWNWECQGPRIGGFSVTEGQLTWSLAGRDDPVAAFCVLADGDQVLLKNAEVREESFPVMLEIEAAGGEKLAVKAADILESAAEGIEVVHAKR
ncbi:MAG: hypothetical protein ABIJ56_09655 [Pseudomonadota bacterium]